MMNVIAKLAEPAVREGVGAALTIFAFLFVLTRVPGKGSPGVLLFLAGLLGLAASFAIGFAALFLPEARVSWLVADDPLHETVRFGLRFGAGLPLLLVGACFELARTRRRLSDSAGRAQESIRRTKDLAKAVEDSVRLEDTLAEKSRDLQSAQEELRRRTSEASRVSSKLRETLSLLLGSEEKFRSIFERANDGFAVIDLETRKIVQANSRMSELTGVPAAELENMDIVEIFGPKLRDRSVNDLRELSRKGGLPPVDFRKRGGGEIRLEVSFSVIDVAGKPVLLGIARDVSERERLLREVEAKNETLEERERNLREANRELSERAEKMRLMNERLRELQEVKDNFLSSVSHELRTPLTSIRSFSEILLQYKDAEEEVKSEFITIINKESERLTRLINDVLDLARIEAGEMKFDMAVVDVAALVDDVCQSLSALARQGNVTVESSLQAELPAVEGDRDKLQQVLTNLVSNAIKFSPEGGIVRIAGRPVEDGMIELSVKDQGPGIPKDDLVRIFEKFRQLDNGERPGRKREGTGLGLAICREIVMLHGGKIWARSTVGEGSTFCFTARAYRVAEPAPAPAPAPAAKAPPDPVPEPPRMPSLPPLRRAGRSAEPGGRRDSLPPLVEPTLPPGLRSRGDRG